MTRPKLLKKPNVNSTKPLLQKPKAKVTKREVIPALEELLEEMAAIKTATKQEGARYYELEAMAIDLMDRHGLKEYNGERSGALLKSPGTETYDEVMLRQLVGEEIWAKITDRVLNKDKLKSAIHLGIVSPKTVGKCLSIKPSKRYIIPS